MINIAVGGAQGKVGRLLVEAINSDPDLNLAAGIIHLKEGAVNALMSVQAPVDVFIDFSVPVATMEHLAIALERQYRMVIGVTGFTDSQKQKIALAAREIPIILAPNMSIGVNVSYTLLEMVAKVLRDRADIAIVDIHHKHKKDSPSGTALHMAEVIHTAKCGQSNQSKKDNIQFSSLQLGDTAAEITAIFALEGERIEITHRAENRSIFAKGALKAAQWLLDKKPGLYDMQDVLGLKTKELPS